METSATCSECGAAWIGGQTCETYFHQTLVAGMTLAEARTRPAPESWSALEVICHLCDEEREDFRQRLDIILHRPQEPFPPIDPQGWVTTRHHNERDLAEMIDNFAAERA
jgi:hypothetical protein